MNRMPISDSCQHRRLVIAGLVHDHMEFDIEKMLQYTCDDGGLSKLINRIVEHVGIIIITTVIISSCEP